MTPGTGTLVQSSDTTRLWLDELRLQLPRFEYREAQFYASFRDSSPQRVVAYLNPARRSVRLFLLLPPEDHRRLARTPSTSGWAARFPSIFRIGGKQDLAIARQLIEQSASVRPIAQHSIRPAVLMAEELRPKGDYFEGAARSVTVNAYERNRRAREACLRHHGRICTICGMTFERRYGPELAGFIQVHHVVPLAEVGKRYRLDPIVDLRPVCPNCHAVLHRREPPYLIEEVRAMVRAE